MLLAYMEKKYCRVVMILMILINVLIFIVELIAVCYIYVAFQHDRRNDDDDVLV